MDEPQIYAASITLNELATVNVVTSSLYGIVDPGSWKNAADGMSQYEAEKRMRAESRQLDSIRSI